MKKLLILLLALGIAMQPSLAGKPKKTTFVVSYVYDNIIEGYDHKTVGKLFVDGELVYESKEHLESQKQTFSVDIKPGKHDIRLETWALYEGTWELHSVENDYSIDGFIDDDLNFSKSRHTLTIVFDIDAEEPTYKFR